MQNIGYMMTCACGTDAIFSDYWASTNQRLGGQVPDVVIVLERNGSLRVVGELKVPWIDKHVLEDAILNENRLRHVLGNAIKHKS